MPGSPAPRGAGGSHAEAGATPQAPNSSARLRDDLRPVCLAYPLADRGRRALELPSQRSRRTARANQLNNLPPILRRVERNLLRQVETSSAQSSGVHQNRSTPPCSDPFRSFRSRPARRRCSRVGVHPGHAGQRRRVRSSEGSDVPRSIAARAAICCYDWACSASRMRGGSAILYARRRFVLTPHASPIRRREATPYASVRPGSSAMDRPNYSIA